MKSLVKILAVLAVALLSGPSAFLHAKEKSVGKESLGKITAGQKAEDLVGLLGKPASKGKVAQMEATGEWVQEWKYPALGVRLSMGSNSKNGPMTVSQIWGEAGCKLATRRGIKIGDTIAAVRKAYGDVEDKSRGRSSDHFVAGSIYGGVFFDLKDGKVTQIFIGANAE